MFKNQFPKNPRWRTATILKKNDGGHRPSSKTRNRDISIQNHLAAFDEILHDGTLVLQAIPAVKNNFWQSKVVDGRHFRNVKCAISAAVWPILMKFGMTMHISLPTWWLIKMSKLKIQDYRQQPSWKSKNYDISETVWPVLAKFCMITLICPPESLPVVPKINFKNPRWRTSAILVILNVISLQPFDWFWWNLVWQYILAFPTWWATKNLKI